MQCFELTISNHCQSKPKINCFLWAMNSKWTAIARKAHNYFDNELSGILNLTEINCGSLNFKDNELSPFAIRPFNFLDIELESINWAIISFIQSHYHHTNIWLSCLIRPMKVLIYVNFSHHQIWLIAIETSSIKLIF